MAGISPVEFRQRRDIFNYFFKENFRLFRFEHFLPGEFLILVVVVVVVVVVVIVIVVVVVVIVVDAYLRRCVFFATVLLQDIVWTVDDLEQMLGCRVQQLRNQTAFIQHA